MKTKKELLNKMQELEKELEMARIGFEMMDEMRVEALTGESIIHYADGPKLTTSCALNTRKFMQTSEDWGKVSCPDCARLRQEPKKCTCPHCGGEINPAALLGSRTSETKAAAVRENGKKGGRPRKQTEAPK